MATTIVLGINPSCSIAVTCPSNPSCVGLPEPEKTHPASSCGASGPIKAALRARRPVSPQGCAALRWPTSSPWVFRERNEARAGNWLLTVEERESLRCKCPEFSLHTGGWSGTIWGPGTARGLANAIPCSRQPGPGATNQIQTAFQPGTPLRRLYRVRRLIILICWVTAILFFMNSSWF
jgi:hypothetical protein